MKLIKYELISNPFQPVSQKCAGQSQLQQLLERDIGYNRFLELFFRNLLFGDKNELHNRALHIAVLQSALRTIPTLHRLRWQLILENLPEQSNA